MPKPDGFRSLHLHIPPDFHKKLKVAVAMKDTTIRDYIMKLVNADLERMSKRKPMPPQEVISAGK